MAFMPGQANKLEVQVSSSGVSVFVGSMDQAIAKLASFKRAVGLAGAALAGLAGGAMLAATSAAADFETAMVEVEKVTDPQTAAAMSEEVMGLAETIPLAQEELAGLAADAARFGIRGTENLTRFTEVAAKMATATDLSATEAGESLAKLATLTKTPISEIENLGSAINSLSNNFATSSSEIVDSMLRSSAALSQLGLNQRQIAGLSAAINEVSASSRLAGTRMRRFAQELQTPQTLQDLAGGLREVGELMPLLGEHAGDLEVRYNDAEVAIETANARLSEEQAELRGLQDELRETDSALSDLNERHDEFGDVVADNRIKIKEIRLEARKEGRDLTESEKEQIEELELANEELRLKQDKLERQMDETRDTREDQSKAVEDQKKVVDSAKDSLEAEKDELAELDKVAAERFRALVDENPQKAIFGLAEAMREGGDAADVINENLSTTSRQLLSGLGQNLGGARDALDLANDSFEDGDSLQREFAAAADTLNNRLKILNNNIRNNAIQVGNEFLPAISDAVEGANDYITAGSSLLNVLTPQQKAFGLLGLAVGGAALALSTFVTGPMALAVGAIAGLGIAIHENIGGMGDLFDDVLGTVSDMLEDLEKPIDTVLDAFDDAGDEIEDVLDAVEDALSGVVDFTRRVVLPAFEYVWGDVVMPIVNTAADAFARNLEPVLDEVGQTINDITGYAETVGGILLDVWNSVDHVIVPIIEGFVDILETGVIFAIDTLADGLQLVMNLVQGDFGAALDNLQDMLGNAIDAAFDIVGVITDGLAAVAEKGVPWVLDQLGGIFSGALETALDVFGVIKNGLAKVGRQSGKWVRENWDNVLIDALRLSLDVVGVIAEGLAAVATKGVPWVLGKLAGVLGGAIYTAIDVAGAIADGLVWIATQGPQWVTNKLSGFLINLGNAIEDTVTSAVERGLLGVLNPSGVRIPTGPFLPGLPLGGPMPMGQTGGFVEQTGAAVIHEGEQILSAETTNRIKGGGALGELELVVSHEVPAGNDPLESLVRDMSRVEVESRLRDVELRLKRLKQRRH